MRLQHHYGFFIKCLGGVIDHRDLNLINWYLNHFIMLNFYLKIIIRVNKINLLLIESIS